MRSTTISRLFIALTVLSLAGLAPIHTYADAESDDLRSQVKALNERIVQLEQQLAEKNSRPVTVPRGVLAPSLADDIWDPFAEMQRMRAQMNQLFEDSFDRGFGPGSAGFIGPQANIKETTDNFIITMNLPGMDKDKINVEVKNGMLVVSGERSAETQVSGDQFSRQERSVGHFLKAIALPNGAKPDDVKAEYKDGILEIKLGRVAGTKPDSGMKGKKIQVN